MPLDRRHKLIASAALAAALLIAFGLGLMVQIVGHSAKEDYPSYKPDQQIEAGAIPNKSTAALKSRKPCDTPIGVSESGLCAQWRATITAESAAIDTHRATNWGIAGVFFSLLTVIGLLFSIRQTNLAISEARKANSISEKVARQATRPYIYPKSAGISSVKNGTAVLQLILYNYGSAPALDFSFRSKFYVMNWLYRSLRQVSSNRINRHIIAPHAEVKQARDLSVAPLMIWQFRLVWTHSSTE